MSRRAWGWLVLAIVLLVAGVALCGVGGSSGMGLIPGCVLCLAGVLVGLWVALEQRSMLIAEPRGFTFRSWRGNQTIAWNRLSSLQLKNSKGSYYATDIVVVNDMGRKEMEIPVHLFERGSLHEWLRKIPARTSGLENLLD